MRITNLVLREVEGASKLALSFSGCGFLGAYNFGAAKRLLQENEKIGFKIEKIAGASAGSLVASMIVLAPEKLDAGVETLYKMADQVIDDFLPKDVYEAQGKLYISLTKRRPWENVMISQFDSREHLIQCLLASCYIPMYSMGYRGVPPIINETECIDGGMTNNLPTFSDVPTITCSPFSSQADICPEDPSTRNLTFANQQFKASYKNLHRGVRALFPPTRQILEQYYEMGRDDADRFIRLKKILVEK